MRAIVALACCVSSLAVAAPDREVPRFKPFTAAGVGAVMIVPESVPADLRKSDYRAAFEGRVKTIKADTERGTLVVVGDNKFHVALPSKMTLPFRVGDSIKVELWSTTANPDGSFAAIHARITDYADAVLLFQNVAPPGWTIELGPGDSGSGRPDYPLATGAVLVSAPEPTTVLGWVQGKVDGVAYVVFGQSQVAVRPRPDGGDSPPSSVIHCAVIRVK